MLELIDWAGVGFSAMWILGLSVNLAALGMADYHRARTGHRLRDVWAEPGYQLAHNAGMMLVCLGLIGSARALWEQIIWGALVLAFAAFGWQAYRARQ